MKNIGSIALFLFPMAARNSKVKAKGRKVGKGSGGVGWRRMSWPRKISGSH